MEIPLARLEMSFFRSEAADAAMDTAMDAVMNGVMDDIMNDIMDAVMNDVMDVGTDDAVKTIAALDYTSPYMSFNIIIAHRWFRSFFVH